MEELRRNGQELVNTSPAASNRHPHARRGTGKSKGNLSREKRRRIALAALEEDNVSGVARRYGISRRTVYDLMDDALADPEGALEDARKELEYRERVRQLLNGPHSTRSAASP